MGSLLGLLVGKTVLGKTITEPIARFVLTAVLFIGMLGAFAALVAAYNHHIIAANQAKTELRAKPATDKAASERATDAIANSKQEQELHNAVQAQPDQPISPTSHALACERLHNAGRNPPACR